MGAGNLKLDIGKFAPGWILVESRLEMPGRRLSAVLRIRSRLNPGTPVEIPLPIMPDGRILEMMRLPDGEFDAEWQLPAEFGCPKPHLEIRPIGWFGRGWRMTNRTLRTYLRLSRTERRDSGLTMWRLLRDLHGAYRIASEFRVHYSMEKYAHWITRFGTLCEVDRVAIGRQITRFAVSPCFHLLVIADRCGPGAMHITLDSIKKNLYADYTCTLIGCADETPLPRMQIVKRDDLAAWLAPFNASLSGGKGNDWIMLLEAGTVLTDHSLYWLACEAQLKQDTVIIYADDDLIGATGERSGPRFKPDWSLAHLRATDYIGSAAVFRADAVAAAGGLRPDCLRHGNFDLLLRVIDAAGERVSHIAAALLHRQISRESDDEEHTQQVMAWQRQVLEAHLGRNGITAAVENTLPGCRRIRFRLPADAPLVSIIVPTRDQVGLLRSCVESVLTKTAYPAFELLIVDNQSVDVDALAYLREIAARSKVRVLRYDRPFNYSAINNFAVGQSQGTVICLLNNDTEVISPDWLDEMVGHLLQPRVGAVGAKLYYGDGRVQHGGDVVGPGGCANHLHSAIGRDDPGYCNRAAVAQELSAVTAACLVTWRALYEQLGGLDEKDLAVAFNDVDYCLRLRAAGHRVVWTPHAELYHHESVSRGKANSWRRKLQARHEVMVMRRRWAREMQQDPFYNPNLSYQQADFSLSHAPRVRKPWR